MKQVGALKKGQSSEKEALNFGNYGPRRLGTEDIEVCLREFLSGDICTPLLDVDVDSYFYLRG